MNDAAALEPRIVTDGESWARDVAAELRRGGRPVAGGWPGTRSEARARAWPHVAVLREDERSAAFERLAQLLYTSARRTWLSIAHDVADE